MVPGFGGDEGQYDGLGDGHFIHPFEEVLGGEFGAISPDLAEVGMNVEVVAFGVGFWGGLGGRGGCESGD